MMLGKTNITAIKEGTTVTDIEDYSWKSMKIDGVSSDFIKAVYGNNMLAAITRDGAVLCTVDGENWKKTQIDTEGDYELEDIIWTGSQYIIAGNRKEIVLEEDSTFMYHGMVITSENLVDFIIDEDADNTYSRYYAIVEKDGSHIIISKEYNRSVDEAGVYAVTKNNSGSVKKLIATLRTYVGQRITCSNKYEVVVAKNNGSGAIYVGGSIDSAGISYCIYRTSDWMEYYGEHMSGTAYDFLSMFECKGYLYYCDINGNLGYSLYKIVSNVRVDLIYKGKPLFFIDAVYINKCEIFLTKNSLLVIRNGDSITDKMESDLIEITYDFEIKFIKKAFNKLYIFGAGGNILVSCDGAQNDEISAVKTMSAIKALYDAKAYTDEKYAALEARIIELENKIDLIVD